MTVDVRNVIIAWAKWGVANKGLFNYEEARPFPLYVPSAGRPITDDCSATVTLWFWLAGAPDPMDAGYDGSGNTETLWSNAAARNAVFTNPLSTQGGTDLAIFYEGDPTPGASVHTALITTGGVADPMTVSHGDPSQPASVTVSQDGRPHVFARFPTTITDYRAIRVPPGWHQPIPGSPLSRVPSSFRPAPIAPPTCKLGDVKPHEWIAYGRWGLQAAHCGPVAGRFIPSPRVGGFGSFTEEAVLKFQGIEKLPMTGELDEATWFRLGCAS